MIKSKTILLVDDDLEDLEFFMEALSQTDCQFHVSKVNSASQCMKFLQANVLPDYIFMDLNMPAKNGFECLQDIRANPEFHDIVIAMNSTSQNLREIHRCRSLGADFYIVKPTNLKVYSRFLQKLLDTVELTPNNLHSYKDFVFFESSIKYS